MTFNDLWEGREGRKSSGSLGPVHIPPPPPTKEVQTAKMILMQIMDWVNIGDKEMQRQLWKILSEYANKQAERPIIKVSEQPVKGD